MTTCEIVKSFLASEKVKVLNHPPYSPDLSPCDFFLFQRFKKMLSGNKYTSRSSLGSSIYQCHQQIPKEDYLSVFRDWVKKVTTRAPHAGANARLQFLSRKRDITLRVTSQIGMSSPFHNEQLVRVSSNYLQ